MAKIIHLKTEGPNFNPAYVKRYYTTTAICGVSKTLRVNKVPSNFSTEITQINCKNCNKKMQAMIPQVMRNQ